MTETEINESEAMDLEGMNDFAKPDIKPIGAHFTEMDTIEL